jgi:alpha-1,3-rhamnosyltransferase
LTGMAENNNPLVSVIVSCYNHEQYIEECILSIVNQTYKPIELIVIDDGSVDNSPVILRRLRDQYGFFLEVQANMGIAKTLNKAIRNYSHGKYLAGCGSDDFWAPDRIEKQVLYMEAHPEYAMVFGKVHTVDKNGRIIANFNIIDPVTDRGESPTFESLVERNPIPAMTVLLRKDIWEACGGYSEDTIIEDLDMWLKVAYRYRIGYLDDYSAYYRWHGNNATADTLSMENAVWAILQNRRDMMSPPFAKKMLARRASISFNILSRRHKKAAWGFLKKNCSYWDGFILKNYAKGFFKLVFCWKKNGKSLWK